MYMKQKNSMTNVKYHKIYNKFQNIMTLEIKVNGEIMFERTTPYTKADCIKTFIEAIEWLSDNKKDFLSALTEQYAKENKEVPIELCRILLA